MRLMEKLSPAVTVEERLNKLISQTGSRVRVQEELCVLKLEKLIKGVQIGIMLHSTRTGF